MPQPILPIDEFLALQTEEQVEKLKQWKMDYTLKDIRDAWGFKHSAQYYMLLKKLRIYERVVNKSDKFSPEQLLMSRSSAEAYSSIPAAGGRSVPEDQFGYELNVTLSGPELAEKLERLAYFLKGERKTVSVKLSISASGSPAPEADEADGGS
ncbi:hypothetical protein GXP70_08290 [Paenibacillus lycopersici]|uniref:Uncharacterized protein n=1 Tax=Paenibacillus lycopersici TaxID=2704462 RepID=A0A6C0FV93_9BACL|nr:hypothetical protein [Paenibacillus lycopersici]QHT59952.1 hypothetical protein GXP70_08290 [Paenibacillus lycopersici]